MFCSVRTPHRGARNRKIKGNVVKSTRSISSTVNFFINKRPRMKKLQGGGRGSGGLIKPPKIFMMRQESRSVSEEEETSHHPTSTSPGGIGKDASYRVIILPAPLQEE